MSFALPRLWELIKVVRLVESLVGLPFTIRHARPRPCLSYSPFGTHTQCSHRNRCPVVYRLLDPDRNRNGANVLRSSDQVSVIFPELEVLYSQADDFGSRQAAPEQKGDDGTVTFSAQFQITVAFALYERTS